MAEKEFAEIFSKRLRYYLEKYEITQVELSKRLGVGTTSVYNWCNGIKTPRMDKIDAMCKIFHCKRMDLITESECASSAPVLTTDENTLLMDYRKLNEKGRAKVREYAHDLTNNSDYTEDGLSSGVKTVAG